MNPNNPPQGAVVVVSPTQTAVIPVAADPAALRAALANYREVQAALDEALPNSVMTIRGKRFRTKSYWRAVATTFNLSVEVRDEKHVQAEKSGDWGWMVLYRASAPNGRTADGDGSCFASEKPGSQATVHNVRAHAHTRSYNRAVSNLVGFGEVSAEEMMDDTPAEPVDETQWLNI